MSKKTWIIIALLIVSFFGFFLINDKPKNEGPSVTTSGEPKKIVPEDHLNGSPAKKIVVMEYLDFQCPGCGSLYPTMKQVGEKYKDSVTFVMRHFPLSSIHSNAVAAARAAEAAGSQNKFFEMADLLFATQQSWSSLSTANAQKRFEEYAQQLGLNGDTFKQDFAAQSTLERINASRDRGTKMGVTGTPTVFINGERLEINAEEDLDKAISKAITENKTDPSNASQ